MRRISLAAIAGVVLAGSTAFSDDDEPWPLPQDPQRARWTRFEALS